MRSSPFPFPAFSRMDPQISKNSPAQCWQLGHADTRAYFHVLHQAWDARTDGASAISWAWSGLKINSQKKPNTNDQKGEHTLDSVSSPLLPFGMISAVYSVVCQPITPTGDLLDSTTIDSLSYLHRGCNFLVLKSVGTANI